MNDRPALLAALSLLAVLALSQACAGRVDAAELPTGATCDPDARARSWTPEQKAETRRRVWAACKSVGGSDRYCAFWIAAVWRESWGGVASAVHTLGTDVDGHQEYGLGPMGLSVKWHRDKWPGDDEDPAFCSPEVSFVVGHAIATRGAEVYQTRDAIELQAVFGGGRGVRHCWETGAPRWWRHIPILRTLAGLLPRRTECRVIPRARHARAVCGRMRDQGHDCRAPLTRADMGEAIPFAARRAWALGRP